MGSAHRRGKLFSDGFYSVTTQIEKPSGRDLILFDIRPTWLMPDRPSMCVFVFCSPPEPCVRYGVLPGEWVGGEHRTWQECELDVHPERQHAGETLLHRLGFLPTVSFITHSIVYCILSISAPCAITSWFRSLGSVWIWTIVKLAQVLVPVDSWL